MELLIIICVVIIFGLIYKLIKREKKYQKVLFKYIFLSLLFSLLLELFFFNFRSFESLFYGQSLKPQYKLGEGIKCVNECYITNSKKAYIEINNINKNIHNIYIDMDSNSKNLIVQIDYYLKDEGNSVYYNAGNRTYTEKLEISKYNKINPSGKLKSIKLDFWPMEDKFNIKDIKFNVRIPIIVNCIRYMLCTIIIFIIISVRPKSTLNKISFNSASGKVVTLIVILLLSGFNIRLAMNSKYVKEDVVHYQYNHLAEALIDGHFDLSIKPSKELLEMDNPYDLLDRTKKEVNYYWDYAFYKGKYYTYFGIVPCLMFYVPVHLIFDRYLPDYIVFYVVVTIFIISTYVFLYQLCKKYFKNISLPLFILFGLFMIYGSGFTLALSEPTYYNIPILLAVAFSYFGLSCYIASTEYNKKYKSILLLLGSSFIALIAGTRPQLLVAMILAIPILWEEFKNEGLFNKRNIKNTLCLALPYVVVALLIMYYNYARFSSPFDFGANYNLTTNDMVHRGLHIDRLPLGLYTYLFEIPRITSTFPFVLRYSVNTTYLGTTISEIMRGGFMIINFVCLVALIPWKFKNVIKNKSLYYVTILSSIFALIIILVDTNMAGILMRYFMDFSWLFTLSTVIIILSLFNKYKNDDFRKVVISLLFISILYNALIYVTQASLYIDQDLLYEKIYHLFIFWL